MKLKFAWPLLAVLGILASAVPSFATGAPTAYVYVHGSHVRDATGQFVSNATICWAPVNNAGVPIAFVAGDGGPSDDTPICVQVTSGSFALTLADTALTNPLNLCYAVTLTDNVSGRALFGPGFGCVQPATAGPAESGPQAWCTAVTGDLSGQNCTFDDYIPNMAALVLSQAGTQGPPGPMGTLNWRGNWAATTAYAQNDGYVSSGSTYVVKTAYTSGASFGTTDTNNAVVLATGCPLSGCNYTGAIGLPGNPTTSLQAVPKQYADSGVSSETGRAEGVEATNATAIGTETTRAEGVEATNAAAIGTETTRAEGVEATNAAAIATKLAAAGALGAIIPGASEAGSGSANHVDLPGAISLGGTLCPTGLLAGTGCAFGMALNTATIGPGANQLPAASTFALSAFNPIYMIGDGASACDATIGGGSYTVPVFTDGVTWHSFIQCSGSSGGGGGGGSTTTAVINEEDTLSYAASVAAYRPSGGGNTPGKKIEADCATGYSGGSLQPTSSPVGHRYCTSGEQSTGEGNGGPTEGTITVTQTGSGSISVVNSAGSGGSESPSAVTSNYGLTTYDAICAADATSTAPTGVTGLTAPGCKANSSALLSETTDGTYAAASILFPTSWHTTQCDASDHLFRDMWIMAPTLGNQTRIEFDDNESCSNGNYYGFGYSYSVTNSRFEFLPQANHFVGHGTCSGTWCPVSLSVASGSTAMSGCSGTSCGLTSGHWYHVRKYEHRAATGVTGTSSVPTLFYDQMCIADAGTSGTSGDTLHCYNEIDPATSKQPQGYQIDYGWSQSFDTQIQLYQNTVSSTSQVDIDSDTLVAYSIQTSTSSGGFTQQPTDLGQLNFDSSTLTTNSDGSSSTMTTVGSPSYETANEESGTGAALYATLGSYSKVTFTGAQPSLYARFYLNTPTLSTDSSGAARIFELFNGSGGVFEIYINNSAKTIVAENLATSGTCDITTTALTSSLAAEAWNYIDVYWSEGTSTSTGAFTVLWNSTTPADTNCSQTGINTGYSGTYLGATYAEAGYITDSGSSQNWDIELDNLSLNDSTEPLYGGFIGPISFGGSSQSYQTYEPGVTSDGQNGEIVQGDESIGGSLNQLATNGFAAQCAMSSSTTCTTTVQAYNSTPICLVSPAAATYTGGMAYCSVSGATVTVHAPTSNSLQWSIVTVGNPN